MAETSRIIQMRQETLSQEQIELVIGSLLGDGNKKFYTISYGGMDYG